MALPAPDLPFLTGAAEVCFGAGFHGGEHADGLPFRWMSQAGRLDFDPAPRERFIELWVRSNFHDLTQHIGISIGEGLAVEHELVHGWNPLSVAVPAGSASATLHVDKIFPREYYPGDSRELSVQVRETRVHADADRHGHVVRQHLNHVRNVRELLEGRTSLDSTPPKLGIDMIGTCNVKPPCVYCAWDFNKQIEADNVDVPFGLDTLDHYGAFFDNSLELVNCSIGEPFMMKNIDPLLDTFGDRNKVLEVTTNGQILTDTNIRKLLGRNAHLYISLDAATAETYAKLRNTTFDKLLDNIRRLVKAKGGRGKLPLVYLVFMPMKANVHEVDDFVRLVAELGADRLVLRPLNDSEGVSLVWDRAGYHYDYQKELLPFEQLVHVSGRVAELCQRLDIELSDQMNFGGSLEARFQKAFDEGRAGAAAFLAPEVPAPIVTPQPQPQPQPQPTQTPIPLPVAGAPKPSLGGETLPACTEPWSSLYILRRGTMPCCYGGQPIAPMGDFKQAWNGPLIQGIRRELLHGRFHDYCFASPDCPIVKKAEQAKDLSLLQSTQLWGRRVHDRWARRRYGLPGTIYRTAKHYWRNTLGHLRPRGSRAP